MKKIVIDLNCSETNYEEILQGVEDFLKNNTNCRIVLVGNALQAKHILSKRNVSFSFIDFYDVKETLLDEDNPYECILRRMINLEGRSKAFVNNRPLPVSQLRELGQYLIHLNGQHAPQLLLKSEYQLEIVDNYASIQPYLAQMQTQYQQWRKLHQQVKNFRQQCQENEARRQLLQYQVDELDEFAIKEGEFEEMEETHNR